MQHGINSHKHQHINLIHSFTINAIDFVLSVVVVVFVLMHFRPNINILYRLMKNRIERGFRMGKKPDKMERTVETENATLICRKAETIQTAYGR